MTAVLIAMMLTASVPQTNIEMAEDVLIESCLPLIDSLHNYRVDSVKIEMEGEHSGGWLVEQTIIDVLSEGGITVLQDDETGLFDSPVLSIRPMELCIEYGDISRPWIIGSRKIERIAVCELSVCLSSRGGAVLTVLRTGAVQTDEVTLSDTDVLEGSENWDWLSAEVQDDDGGGLLEPLVVTAVVASLIYLFYSSRAE